MNLLLVSYSLGQRPETMVRLCVGSFHWVTTDEGVEALDVHIGTMKNKQARHQNVGMPLHKQSIYQHSNPNLCAVAAYKRQLSILPSGYSPKDPLFRSARFFSRQLGMQAPSTHTCAGVALWVSQLIGRKVTFKDCARRPVFTKLVNAMPSYDAAKSVGVQPQSLLPYHRAVASEIKAQAARIMAQV
jgi:hypothetical protein